MAIISYRVREGRRPVFSLHACPATPRPSGQGHKKVPTSGAMTYRRQAVLVPKNCRLQHFRTVVPKHHCRVTCRLYLVVCRLSQPILRLSRHLDVTGECLRRAFFKPVASLTLVLTGCIEIRGPLHAVNENLGAAAGGKHDRVHLENIKR